VREREAHRPGTVEKAQADPKGGGLSKQGTPIFYSWMEKKKENREEEREKKAEKKKSKRKKARIDSGPEVKPLPSSIQTGRSYPLRPEKEDLRIQVLTREARGEKNASRRKRRGEGSLGQGYAPSPEGPNWYTNGTCIKPN